MRYCINLEWFKKFILYYLYFYMMYWKSILTDDLITLCKHWSIKNAENSNVQGIWLWMKNLLKNSLKDKKKKKLFRAAKPKINIFLLVWMITREVSLNITLCVCTILPDEITNHVMSPNIVICQYIWRSSNYYHLKTLLCVNSLGSWHTCFNVIDVFML
jgi:hypothetical protein